jgi:hypothetical protein
MAETLRQIKFINDESVISITKEEREKVINKGRK